MRSTLTSLSTGFAIGTPAASAVRSAPRPSATDRDDDEEPEGPDEPEDDSSPTASNVSPTSTDACANSAPARRSALYARQTSSECLTECHNGQSLPVVLFHDTPETRELIVSMCCGIATTGGGRGGDGDFDVLTYDPADKLLRRRQAKCRDFCAQ